MPLKLDVKKKMTQRSDRVKSVDMHPTEPWVLCALYSGKVVIYNYETGTVYKSFDVSDHPVRCAKFIVRKQWIIAGADDMVVRVFNYNTMEKVKEFEAHQDYIRYLEVHPSLPYVLSSSDDMSVRLWDWEKGWACTQTYEGHAHYVMMVRINPKDTNTFATASLDRSVKVWSLSSPTPNYSLEGHERGVNCVDYFPGGGHPYLVSGSDDWSLRIWDYQTRSCVAHLEGHTNNVCAVAFHSRLPLIISGSEDGTVRVWHNSTHRLEATLNYGYERCWALCTGIGNNKVALGFDDGTVVVKLGKESPVASMDRNGKIIVARNNIVHAATIKAAAAAGAATGGAGTDDPTDDGAAGAASASAAAVSTLVDGEPVPVSEKELDAIEHFPQHMAHNSNGRYVAITGDNEYVIYTSQALRTKSNGVGLDFVWSTADKGSGDYAVRESSSRVRVFKNFKEAYTFKPPALASVEGIYGGALLGVRSQDTLIFYDWDAERVVRRIEVGARDVVWNESGELVAVTTDDSFFVLRFDRAAYTAAIAGAATAAASGSEEGAARAALLAEEGVEEAFTLQHEIGEKVRGKAVWIGDCLLYTNAGGNRLNYYVGGEVMTLAHLDTRPTAASGSAGHLYLLGYVPRDGRVYLMDKQGTVVSYALLLSLVEYQTAVVRRDFSAANKILPEIPVSQYNAVAKFLDSQGFKEEALTVAQDADLKFEYAVQLGHLETAHSLLKAGTGDDATAAASAAGGAAAVGAAPATAASTIDSADAAAKWKTLMDMALARSNLALAEECATAARDVGSLLLIYTSTGNAAGMAKLAALAREEGRINIAMMCLHTLGRVEDAARLMADTGRIAEAAFYARTFCPSLIAGELLPLWRADAAKHSKRAAEALADPLAHGDRFPDFPVALQAEAIFKQQRASGQVIPASAYPHAKADLDVDVIGAVKTMMAAGVRPPTTTTTAATAAAAPAAAAPPAGAAAAAEPVTPPAAAAPAAPVVAAAAPAAPAAAAVEPPVAATAAAAVASPVDARAQHAAASPLPPARAASPPVAAAVAASPAAPPARPAAAVAEEEEDDFETLVGSGASSSAGSGRAVASSTTPVRAPAAAAGASPAPAAGSAPLASPPAAGPAATQQHTPANQAGASAAGALDDFEIDDKDWA